MNFKGKLFLLLLLSGFLSTTIFAEKTSPDNNQNHEASINDAVIKEPEIATATYDNLPKNEVINTLFEDPLSDSFMGKESSIFNKERNRSTSDLLSEFEGQASEINSNTVIPDKIEDNHSKEDRERIEARADELLKEAAIRESKDNSGESLLQKDDEQEFNRLQEKIKSINKKTKTNKTAKELNEDKKDSLIEKTDGNENEEKNNESDVFNANKKDSEQIEKSPDNEKIEPLELNDLKDLTTKNNKSWPNTNEDPEFSKQDNVQVYSKEDVEIFITPDTSASTDEIPNYEELQGIIKVEEDNQKVNSKKEKVKSKKERKKKLSRKKRKLKKLFNVQEPILLTDGKPKSEDDESVKTHKYTGILVPEKQPLNKRKNMIRWVLRLDDGSRIPLKSNLKLMQEVRKESNLEDYVTVTGKMKSSALNSNLKYLVPESIMKSSGKQMDSKQMDSKEIDEKEKESEQEDKTSSDSNS